MKDLIRSAGLLLADLASTFVFLIVITATKNVPLAIVAGMVFGVAQIGWELARRKPIGAMQWLSFVLVLGFGAASLITHDARFIMVKPSVIYLIVGAVMLKPGWMVRYVPDDAKDLVGDLAFAFGYIWSTLMFVSAALVFWAAFNMRPVQWATFVSIWGIVSKASLFVIQYAVMRFIGRRRHDAQHAVVAA
jgi:intracellular septation protein A